MSPAWQDGAFNAEIGSANIREFLTMMENPNKTATRAEFQQIERDLKTFVEARLK